MKGVQEKMRGVAEAAKRVAKVSAVAFAALSVVVYKVARTYADFEMGMVRVGAVSRASETDMKALTAAARSMAAATEFSAKQVADGMGFMAMAGMKSNQIIAAMPSVLQLASAGMIDLSTASDITTNIVAGMGLELKDLAAANDTLVAAMTGANVDATMLGEAFKYVGPVARSAGWTFEGVTAALGKLGNAGIQGSMAGTTLRNVISRLLNPTGVAADEIDRLGLNVKDASGKLRPLTEIIRQLEPHAEDTAAIMKIFGNRAGPGMASLLGVGSKALGEFTDRLKDSRGIAADISERVLQTFAGQMKILNSKWEEAKIAIGEGLVVPLRAMNRAAQRAMDAFNNLSPRVKQFMGYALFAGAALAGMVAAAAGLVALAPAVIGAFGGLAAAMSVAFWPVTIAIGAVAAAIVGVILLVGALRRAWDGNLFGIKDRVEWFTKGFKSIWKDMFTDVDGWWAEFIGGISDSMIMFISWVKGLDPSEAFAIQQEARKGGGLFGVGEGTGAQEFWSGVTESAKAGAGEIWSELKTTFQAGLDTILGGLQEAFPELETVTDDLKMKFDELTAGIPEIPPMPLPGPPGDPPDGPPGGLAEATQKASEGVQVATSALRQFGEGGSLFADVLQGMAEGGIIGAIVSAIFRIIKPLTGFQNILDAFGQLLGRLTASAGPLVKTLAPLIVSILNLVGTVVQLIMAIDPAAMILIAFDQQIMWLADTIGGIANAMRRTWEGLISFLQKVLGMLPYIGDKIVAFLEKFRLREPEPPPPVLPPGLPPEMEEFTENIRELNESMANVPSGFKVALARFEAADPLNVGLGGGPLAAGGAGEMGYNIDTMNVYATDPVDLADQIKDESDWQGFAGTGSPGAGDEARYMGERRRT